MAAAGFEFALYGFLGALVFAATFAAGALAGWKTRGAWDRRTVKQAVPPGEAERRQLKEQQAAFRVLGNYNTETAYGMSPPESTETYRI